MIKFHLAFILIFISSFLVMKIKLAQTGFQFLSVSSDARSGGMADAMTTLHSGSVSLFHNPAGLSKQERRFEVSFSSNNWIAGIKHDAFSLSISPKNGLLGTLGFSLLNVDYGECKVQWCGIMIKVILIQKCSGPCFGRWIWIWQVLI